MPILKKGTTIYMMGDHFAIRNRLYDNSWASIKAQLDSGNAPASWLGQEKQFVGNDGYTYKAKIIDMQEGRYKRVSDNAYNHAVFQLDFLLPSTYLIDSANFQNMSLLTELTSGAIWQNLPSDLRAIIEPMYIKCASQSTQSGYENPTDVEVKLFIPACAEIGGTASLVGLDSMSIFRHETISYKTNTELGSWDLYATATNDNRKKYKVDSQTSVGTYILRSTNTSGSNNGIIVISTNGGYAFGTTGSSFRVSVCFAI